jgi:murein DD-endopeptidase
MAQALARFRRHLLALLALCAVSGVVACASAHRPAMGSAPHDPYRTPRAEVAREAPAHPVAAVAQGLIGAPYRYGGTSPKGFDCSGLVYYSYRKAGIPVPRTAREQLRASQPMDPSRLRPGDVVFFRLSGRKPSHVGIYVGRGRFVHAPSSGKRVSYASLRDPYWQERLIGAGRF